MKLDFHNFNYMHRVFASADGKSASSGKASGSNESKALHQEPVKYKPKAHQDEAIQNVIKGFENNDRGQLILPCGAGKTTTSLWIKEGMQAKKTLVLVPSIGLVKQTKKEWDEQKSQDFDYLCVCSDSKVNAVDKEESYSKEALKELKKEANEKVTTDPQKISEFLQSANDSVIYSTYQSLPKIMEALKKNPGFEFDITFADEAHKSTGKEEKLFGLMHSDDNLPSKKRLYMTATPKVHKMSKDGDYANIVAMNDKKIYGPEFHRMSFADAIEQKILADYEVIAVGVDEDELGDKYPAESHENLMEIANNYALKKVMDKYGASHALSFHSRNKKAKAFADNHNSFFPEVHVANIKGTDDVGKRDEILGKFKNNPTNKQAVISNARCLTEGIDVPSIDMVYFADPKESQVDIVQATGRAIRLDKRKPNKTGYVVVPIITKKGQTAGQASYTGKFKNIVTVLNSLADHDERLEAQIKMSPEEKQKAIKTGDIKPKVTFFGFNEELASSFSDEIIASSREILGESKFDSLEQLCSLSSRVYDSEPENLDSFWQSSNVSGAGIRRKDFNFLARKEGKIKEDASLSAQEIRTLIWSGSDSEIEKELKEISPQRPKDPLVFFKRKAPMTLNENADKERREGNDNHKNRQLGENRITALLNLYQRKAKEGLAFSAQKINFGENDAADRLWGTQYTTVDQVREAIKAHFEDFTTANSKEIEDLLDHGDLGIGKYKLIELIQKENLAEVNKKFDTKKLLEVLFGDDITLPAMQKLIAELQGEFSQRPKDYETQILTALRKHGLIYPKYLDDLADLESKEKAWLKKHAQEEDVYPVLAQAIWTQELKIGDLKELVQNRNMNVGKEMTHKENIKRAQSLGVSILELRRLASKYKLPGQHSSILLTMIKQTELSPDQINQFFDRIAEPECPADIFLSEKAFSKEFGFSRLDCFNQILRFLRSFSNTGAMPKANEIETESFIHNLQYNIAITEGIFNSHKNELREQLSQGDCPPDLAKFKELVQGDFDKFRSFLTRDELYRLAISGLDNDGEKNNLLEKLNWKQFFNTCLLRIWGKDKIAGIIKAKYSDYPKTTSVMNKISSEFPDLITAIRGKEFVNPSNIKDMSYLIEQIWGLKGVSEDEKGILVPTIYADNLSKLALAEDKPGEIENLIINYIKDNQISHPNNAQELQGVLQKFYDSRSQDATQYIVRFAKGIDSQVSLVNMLWSVKLKAGPDDSFVSDIEVKKTEEEERREQQEIKSQECIAWLRDNTRVEPKDLILRIKAKGSTFSKKFMLLFTLSKELGKIPSGQQASQNIAQLAKEIWG